MASLVAILNRLIPFATPGTPFFQDILHLAVLCAALYFAPQIQQRFQGNWAQSGVQDEDHAIPGGGADVNGNPAGGIEDDALVIPQPDPQNVQRQPHILHDREASDIAAAAAVAHNERPDTDGHDFAHNRPPADQTPARERNVGAKKAKSLARKDQRRAYHEFMRAQGDSQRTKDAEGAEAREEALAAERERRKLAERQLESQKTAEREAKRRKEEAMREDNARRIDFVLHAVREELDADRTSDLFRIARAAGDDVDEEWVEQVLKASGLLGMRDGTMIMITEMGWAVRVTLQDMEKIYHSAAMGNVHDEQGQITHESLGNLLTASLRDAYSIPAG